ncbi:MAG: hypothetical protein KY464_04565 [Gemmatimonadetes bacterium]|nr:hypothetical protein [Gemmatimonadota bacterium]
MSKNRLFSMLAVFALVGFAACGGGEEGSETEVTQDTMTVPGTEMVEVPTTDTAVVTTEVTVDSTTDTTVVN